MQIAVEGILAHHEIIGKAKKGKILILHGWGRSSHDWNQIAQKLSSQYQVILLDLPGFGDSTIPESEVWGIFEYAEIVEKFIKKLGLKKITLIGHSFGGEIALVIAAKNPVYLEKLILVDSAGVDKAGFWTKVKIKIFKIGKIVPLPKQLYEALVWRLGSKTYASAGKLRTSFKKIENQDVSYLIPSIKTPTLIVWGEKDLVLSVNWARKMKDLIKNSTLRIVWGVGHHPHLEKPNKFLEIIKEYL